MCLGTQLKRENRSPPLADFHGFLQVPNATGAIEVTRPRLICLPGLNPITRAVETLETHIGRKKNFTNFVLDPTMRAFVADGMVAPRMWNSIMLEIIGKTQIHESELLFRASRSGGPGGQNVNKLNTRMTLLFDVAGSPSLSDEQKRRVRTALSTRIDKQGVLRVASQRFRTQEANRQAAVERFVQLLAEALAPRPVRRKTKVPAGAREQRLRDKKHRSRLKQQRSDKGWEL